MMQLIVNGEPEQCPDGCSIAALLCQRGHEASQVVVEVNGSIVPAAAFAATVLQGGEQVEIVQFVGGG